MDLFALYSFIIMFIQYHMFVFFFFSHMSFNFIPFIFNMPHGAGIFTTFAQDKSPSYVGKYTSTMEHMGIQ